MRGGEVVAIDAGVELAGDLGDGPAQVGVQVGAGRGESPETIQALRGSLEALLAGLGRRETPGL